MFIDTHCHIHDLDAYRFVLSRAGVTDLSDYAPERLLARSIKTGVSRVICIGTTFEDSLRAQAFSAKRPEVFWTFGIHPDEVETPGFQYREPEVLKGVSETSGTSGISERASASGNSEDAKASENSPVAIGEIGLDYHRGTKTRLAQIKLLEQQLDLAARHDLPCTFHVREAFDDFWPVFDNFHLKTSVIHSFSDSRRNLERALSRGLYVGVNGIATFANLPLPPLERILLETDAPFLAPAPFRGKVNEPAYIPRIAEFLSKEFGLPLDEVAKVTTRNAGEVFGI